MDPYHSTFDAPLYPIIRRGRKNISGSRPPFLAGGAENRPFSLALRRGTAYHPLALVRPIAGAIFAVTVFLGTAASGCATSGTGFAGFLALQGVEQEVVLQHSGDPLRLAGRPAVLAELDRLVDARVTLRGSLRGDTLHVRDYEILEAPDGMVPFVGRVVVDQSGARIDEEPGGTPIYLRGEDIRSLRRHHGALVWVTGSVVGAQTLLIAHWGLIVPAQ